MDDGHQLQRGGQAKAHVHRLRGGRTEVPREMRRGRRRRLRRLHVPVGYTAAAMTNVLEGIRVLDFGRYIAGPYCAALLADLGADVIRIERIGGGEDRWVAPINEDGIGAMYVTMNRNKRGMTLDPSSPEGREIVKKLVATADVVVANLPPEVLRSLSLDLEGRRRVKPDIILTAVTAFGAGGPWSHKHGFDGIGQVMSGAAYMTGTLETPYRAAVAWVDCGTASLAAFGTLAALMERGKSGRGQKVEGALQRTPEQARQELEGAKIPAGPLYTPQQALDDAHIRRAGLLVDTEYPGVARRVPLAPTPVDLSDTPGRFRHRAPTLGEHTNAILGEIGYSAAEIDALRKKGVV